MRNDIVITKRITLHLTPHAWGLYTSMKFVELVADYLNKQVADAFNGSIDAGQAIARSQKAMENVAEFGAMDTEPRDTLYSLADDFFGDKS